MDNQKKLCVIDTADENIKQIIIASSNFARQWIEIITTLNENSKKAYDSLQASAIDMKYYSNGASNRQAKRNSKFKPKMKPKTSYQRYDFARKF